MTLYPINLLRRAILSMHSTLNRLCQRFGVYMETRRWRRKTLRQLGQRRRD